MKVDRKDCPISVSSSCFPTERELRPPRFPCYTCCLLGRRVARGKSGLCQISWGSSVDPDVSPCGFWPSKIFEVSVKRGFLWQTWEPTSQSPTRKLTWASHLSMSPLFCSFQGAMQPPQKMGFRFLLLQPKLTPCWTIDHVTGMFVSQAQLCFGPILSHRKSDMEPGPIRWLDRKVG